VKVLWAGNWQEVDPWSCCHQISDRAIVAEEEEPDRWVYDVAADAVESMRSEAKVVADRILAHMLDESPLAEAELEEVQYTPEPDAAATVDCRRLHPSRLVDCEIRQDSVRVHHTFWVTVARASRFWGKWSVSPRKVVQAV
jgi:hypothetical protein